MGGKDKRKKAARNSAAAKKKTRCPNCGEMTSGHFVPPSIGEKGFFMCTSDSRDPREKVDQFGSDFGGTDFP